MTQDSSPPVTVRCPICAKAAPYAPENPYRPFCSKRCKMIDLGQWAAEEYRVPQADSPAPADESPD